MCSDTDDISALVAVATARFATLTIEEQWGVAVLADRFAQGLPIPPDGHAFLVRVVG